MAIAHDFDYVRATSLTEVMQLLEVHKEKAKLLAGGTDLTVYLKEGLSTPDLVIDIKDIAELKGIRENDGKLWIGALSTFSDLIESPLIKERYYMLFEASQTVASVGIRNRATLVGNICSAVPSLDSAPALLCYEAVVHVQSVAGKRTIPISEWFRAPRKTALLPTEIVLGIEIEPIIEKHAGVYLKLGRYNGEDLAQAGLSILMTSEQQYRIAHCAVGPVPKRIYSIETLLRGKDISPDLLEQAKEMLAAEISPITDIRSSKEYRLHMCKIMLERGLTAVQERLNGKVVDTKHILGG